MNAHDLDERLFLYVTDTLEDAERLEVERQIERGEADVLAALDRAQRIAEDLSIALEPIEPSPESRAAFFERVHRTDEADASATTPIPIRRTTPATWALAALLLLSFGVTFVAWNARELAHGEALARSEAQLTDREALLAAREAKAQVRFDELKAEQQRISDQLVAQLAERDKAQAEIERLQVALNGRPDRSDEAERLTAELEIAAQTIESQRLALGDAERMYAGRSLELAERERTLELIRAPDVGIVDLFALDDASPASASVFWDGALTHCYLHARGLPSIEDDTRYVLWLEYEGNHIERIGDLDLASTGEATLYEALPTGHGEILRTFVTREPVIAGERQNTPIGPVVMQELVDARSAPGESRRGARRYRRRG